MYRNPSLEDIICLASREISGPYESQILVTSFGSSRTRRITGGEIITFKLGYPVFDGGIR